MDCIIITDVTVQVSSQKLRTDTRTSCLISRETGILACFRACDGDTNVCVFEWGDADKDGFTYTY